MDAQAQADYASAEYWDDALVASAQDALAQARGLLADEAFERLSPDARALVYMTASRSSFELGAQVDARRAAEQALALCDVGVSAPIRFNISLGASAVLAESGAVDAAFGVLDGLEPHAHGIDLCRLATQRAYLLHAAGRLDEALAQCDEAERHFVGPGQNRIVFRMLLFRGVVLLELGRLDEAESSFRSAHDIAVAEGWYQAIGLCLTNLAVVHGRARRLPESIREFDRARAALQAGGNAMRPLAIAETDRAGVMLHSGLIADAVDAAQAVLSLVESSGNQTALADARLLVARCHLAGGQFARAMAAAELAATTFRVTGRPGFELHARSVAVGARLLTVDISDLELCQAVLADAATLSAELREFGWHDDADDLLMAQVRLSSAMRRPDLSSDSIEYLRLGAWRGERATLLRGWYAEALARAMAGDVEAAIEACLAGLDHVDAIVDEAPDLERRSGARRLGADLSELAINLAVEQRDVVTVFGAAEGTRARSLHDEAMLDQRHRALTTDGALALLKELESRLGNDALVMWLIVRADVCAVVLTRDSRRLVRVAPVREVARAQQRVQLWLDEASVAPDLSSDAAERAASLLDELLVRPLDLPDHGAVVLVPVGLLHSVAWSAAPSLAGRRVSLTPSAQIWLQSDRRAARSIRSVGLLVGPELMGSAAELETFEALFPSGVRALGEGATASTMRSLFRSTDLVHVAAHGTFRSDRPLMSSVRLADGEAHLAEVIPPEVRTALVVLSSCEGGANGVSDGSEVLGLSSVLLARGAAAVLAPLTVVRDLECAEFVVDVHRELVGGADLADALAKVRQRWFADHDLSRWAVASSFSCFGSGAVHHNRE
ncbi:MAG TPA: CHAT domain-containing tetratricopeptide repeat protein [Ilumatobacter sp.]|nr:CHAT domain-containing tetratricopeptide repeat protein [Ilumatobacter sp.]